MEVEFFSLTVLYLRYKIKERWAGGLRNTMEPQENRWTDPFQIWWWYHQKWAFCIAFLSYGGFQKGHLETPKRHLEIKWNYGFYTVIACVRKRKGKWLHQRKMSVVLFKPNKQYSVISFAKMLLSHHCNTTLLTNRILRRSYTAGDFPRRGALSTR